MKTFKLFATALMVAMCAMIVTSCSDDNDDNPNNGTNEKRLSKIVEDATEDNITLDFYYTNEKLSKVISTEVNRGGDSYTESIPIYYSSKTVTVVDEGYTQKLYLNNDGWAESGTLLIEDEPPYSFICEYANGYLTKVSYPDADDWNTTRIEIKYDSNGNITNAYEYDSYGVTEFKFTYSNNPAKGKSLFFLREAFSQDDTLDLFGYAYYAGLLGKDSPNLVSKIEIIGEYGSDNITFDYIFNDGYVAKVIVDDDDEYPTSCTFTYE